MIVGTLGAIGNGAGLPVFAVLFGNIVNDLGTKQNDPEALKSAVNNAVPYFLYVGIATFICAYLQGFLWSATAVRQVNRIRGLYLRQVLHQEIGYFDTTGTSGEKIIHPPRNA